MTRSVAVVGAGAIGATTAFDLALRDADVTLFDRDAVAAGSTGRAAGVCYDAFADPIDASIGADAIERFRTFDGHGEFEFHECPYVWLARDGDDRRARAIREQVPRMQEQGLTVLQMQPDELAGRFPSVHHEDVAVAAIAGAAGYTDPGSYARLLSVMATRQGADLVTGDPVDLATDPLRVNGDAYDDVVVATGAHTKQVLAALGYALATKPYRVQALTTDAAYDGPMLYDATAGFYCRPHPDGCFAGDGTETVEANPDDYDRDADDAFVADTHDRLAHRLADGSGDTVDAWAGLCTATPDRDPLVGELDDGLWVATGFQGHGFMRAPAIGERLANRVLDVQGDGDDGRDDAEGDEEGDEDWVAAFDPTRFDGDEEFPIVEGMLPEER